MAKEKILCDECKDQTCKRRVLGAMCSVNKEIQPILRSLQSRDPVQVAEFLAVVIEKENERYMKGIKAEAIGEVKEDEVVDSFGNKHVVVTKGKIDGRVTDIASNLVKTAKTINEILNPQKSPYLQQNNQYNIRLGAVDEISRMTDTEKNDILSFIDDKLDGKR